MPIDMGPPAAGVQPFQIQPTQYTDPLETLARMQQMKTQNLQQQQAQLGLQQAKMQMDSQKAMLKAFVDGGSDPDKTYNLMTQYGVLPNDLLGYQQHLTQLQTQRATLRKDQQEIYGKDADTLAGLYQNVDSQDALNAANAKADAQGVSAQVPRITTYPGDPDHMKAAANSVGMLSQINERTLKGAQIAGELAGTEEKKAATAKTGLETAGIAKQQLVSDIRAMPVDPATGTPTPAAWSTVLNNPAYKNLNLPKQPTQDDITRLTQSTIPEKDLPDYQLKQLKLRMNIFGDNPEELFLARYAQSIKGPGKSVADLSFPEYQRGMQLYAETKQDPQMRQIALAQKGLQEQMTQATLASLPTPQSIDLFAHMMLNHDMSPSQFAELRSGRVAWAPQIFTRAAQIAQQTGKPFSPSTLEADYRTMANTEDKFANGPEAQMARSFSNLMEHVGLLDEARKALPSSNLPLIKAIGNSIGIQTGGTAQTAYDTIADYVANEAAKAFIPSGGGEAERAKNAAHFERNLGQDQIQKNEKILMDLADAQKRGLEFQYQKGTYGKGSQSLFTPQALAVRERFLGPDKPAATAAPPVAPKTPPVPTSIPQQYRSTAHYSPSQQAWYYSTDGGKTFLKAQ